MNVSVITLGVVDLARARSFYVDGLGFRASSMSNEHVVFMEGGGVVLALYGRDALAEDAGLASKGSGFRGVALAHNVADKAAVDRVLARAIAAGAKPLRPAQDVFWGGYSGYFEDPDGHVWEVAWNPHWPLDELGRVQLPR
jgi:catechol 2,3-dioxygenase-like lactoylglutathione lyase family enzyme